MADNSVTRTLRLALRTIGSRASLAEYLAVSESLLEEWLDGISQPPTLVYLRALDLVARGPFTPYSGPERRGARR